jgi:hypothetical protein
MKYHTSNDVYLWLENIYNAKQQKLGQTPPWDLKNGNYRKPGEAEPDDSASVTATAGPKPGSLGGLPADTDPKEDDVIKTEEEEDEDALKAPDDATAALAAVDPAALALEELKHKLPLSIVGADTPGDATDDEVMSDDEAETGPGTGAALLADTGEGHLRPGMFATVSDLDDPTAAAKYNGTRCTIIRQEESGKWLCELEDGGKARLPAAKLTPEGPVLAPGTKMRIEGLEKGGDFNGTVATILKWDKEKKSYQVELFTGQKANIKPWNLHDIDDVPDLH